MKKKQKNNAPVVEDKVEEQEPQNPVITEINTRKHVFRKSFNTYKRVNLILLIVTIVIIAVSYIVLFPIGTNGMWATFIILAVLLSAEFVYTSLMKRRITKKADAYMKDYYQITSDYIYTLDGITDYHIDTEHLKMSLEDFTDARLIKDIYRTGSRNVINYNFNGLQFRVSDYIAYRQEKKVSVPVFLGKLMRVDLNKIVHDRVLIYRKPDTIELQEGQGPDDVEDLKQLINTKKLLVYADNEDAIKFIPQEALNVLENIETGKFLTDISLSFIENKLTVAFSYGDDLMVVPLQEEFHFDAQEKYRNDLGAVHEFITLLKL
jgi:hypothetical protein